MCIYLDINSFIICIDDNINSKLGFTIVSDDNIFIDTSDNSLNIIHLRYINLFNFLNEIYDHNYFNIDNNHKEFGIN